MNNIDVFENSIEILERKSPGQLYSWKIILGFILILVIFIFSCYKFQKTSHYLGVIHNENNSILKLYINEEDIHNLHNQVLQVNNKKTKYEILNISEQAIYTNQGEKQHEVKLKLKEQANDGVVMVNFKSPQTTLIKEIIYKLKKG